MTDIDVLTYGFSLVSDQGPFGFSTISLLTVGDQHVLVDTGPASRRTMLVKTLQARGLAPEEIDLVVLTHMHWDHCANADLFPNARVLVHPKEIDYANNPRRGDHNVASYFSDMLSRLRVEPISDGDRIVEGVSVMDTPGHTKGHVSVAVSMDGRDVLVSGDAMPDGGRSAAACRTTCSGTWTTRPRASRRWSRRRMSSTRATTGRSPCRATVSATWRARSAWRSPATSRAAPLRP